MVFRPTQDGLDPGHYLTGAEGLDDIVIRSQLKTHDLVHFLTLGGEHDDGDLACLADLPADVDAGLARHHDVQHAKGNGAVRRSDGRNAIIAVHRLESLGFEIYLQRLMYDGIVVCDQNFGIHKDASLRDFNTLYHIFQKWEEGVGFLRKPFASSPQFNSRSCGRGHRPAAEL